MSKNSNGYELVNASYFSDLDADYVERYFLYRKRKNWRGKEVFEHVKEYTMFGSFPLRGDLKWAKRVAKHYGIEVPSKVKGE